MSIQPNVLYNLDNGVVTVTLNRPEVHNAFNEIVIGDLTEALKKAGEEKSARVVVLRGNGKSFCAGGDLNWMRRMADYNHKQNVEDAMRLGTLLKTLNNLPKPTIGLIHGNAFGGGVGLAACCDITIAEETAQFCLSEVRIGIIPSVIAPYVIAAMGQNQSRRYFLTAERFDGKTAERVGLIDEAVPVGKLDEACENLIAELWNGAPGAQARGKKLILDIFGKPIDDAVIQHTVEQIAEARASEEGKEGLSAFLNKTEPAWRQRG